MAIVVEGKWRGNGEKLSRGEGRTNFYEKGRAAGDDEEVAGWQSE